MVALTGNNSRLAHRAGDMTSAAKSTGAPARVRWLLAYAKTAYQAGLERRQMLKLSDHQLKDIGITRHQIISESEHTFFDIPHR